MSTWNQQNYVIFENLFLVLICIYRISPNTIKKIRILRYMYKFYYEEIFENKGNMAFFRPFFTPLAKMSSERCKSRFHYGERDR